MAEALQREWSLPVLKVILESSTADPEVRIRLLTHHDGEPSLEGEWTHLLTEFGSWASERGRGPDLHLPQSAVERIAEWIHNRLGSRAELWLHLVKPYAYLGALDWEAELQPALGIPLLRLPDVFPIPEFHRTMVDVAVCASGPAVKGPPPALEALPGIVRAFAGLERQVRLHVFADEAAGSIEFAAAEGETIVVHHPEEAPAANSLWPEVVNPWLRWMLAARGEATDVVHFVGHGFYTSDQGWLALAASPKGDRAAASHIGASEMASFLTSMGAAAVGFSNPLDNYSTAGLRAMVDALGARRAGPVLLHNPVTDPDGAQLQGAYRFLLGERGRRPPPNPSLLFYCQPDRLPRKVVRGLEPSRPETPIDDLGPTTTVRDYFTTEADGSQSKWVAVAERFLDQHRANLLRQRTSSEDPRSEFPLDAYSEGVEQALREIRSIVDRHVQATPSPPSGSG